MLVTLMGLHWDRDSVGNQLSRLQSTGETLPKCICSVHLPRGFTLSHSFFRCSNICASRLYSYLPVLFQSGLVFRYGTIFCELTSSFEQCSTMKEAGVGGSADPQEKAQDFR